MIIDDEWPTLMSDLRRRSPTAYAKAASVRRFIRSDGFWDTCENFLYMVIPVVKALRMFDGKAPATSMALRVMYDLKIHVQGFAEPPFVNRVKSTFGISYWVLKLVGSSRSSRQ